MTLILFGTIFILTIILNLGVTSGTGFHVICSLATIALAAIIFIYWLIKGLLKKQWAFIFKVILTPLIIIIIHYLFNYDRIRMDGKRAELYAFIFGENSNYSSDFTHRAFRQIQMGMAKNELINLIGEPIQILPYNFQSNKTTDTLSYNYCIDGLDTNHRIRFVLLKSDTVISIRQGFYYD